MKTIIATLALLALSSQANANDAVKQNIIGLLKCVQFVIGVEPGSAPVHGDAMVAATRACHRESQSLNASMSAAGFTQEQKDAVISDMVDLMFDAWAAE